MKINLLDGSFYCFRCNVSGDALKFVRLAIKSWMTCKPASNCIESLKAKMLRQLRLLEKHGLSLITLKH